MRDWRSFYRMGPVDGPGGRGLGGSGHGQVALGWLRHDEALTKMAAVCWDKDRFTDVTIFCEDRALVAHRLVLASMSPMLAALLAEAEGADTTLLLPEVKAEDMHLLLQFIYQGEVILPPRRTAALLELAALLCIAGVSGDSAAVRSDIPPSPPHSDSATEQVSDTNSNDCEDPISTTPLPRSSSILLDHVKQEKTDEDDFQEKDPATHDSEEPMDLAKPEIRVARDLRPEPVRIRSRSEDPSLPTLPLGSLARLVHSSTPITTTTSLSTKLKKTRDRDALHYFPYHQFRNYPFSLNLAPVSVNQNHSRSEHPHLRWKPRHSRKSSRSRSRSRSHSRGRDSDSDYDVGVDVHLDVDSDREIDLSIKDKKSEQGCPKCGEVWDKYSSSPGTRHVCHHGTTLADSVNLRLMAADKMLLLPPGLNSTAAVNGNSNGVDPRRTYLDALLQDSLVQQSYIVLPSHHLEGERNGSTSNGLLTQPPAYTRDREDSPEYVETTFQETLSTDTSSDLSPTMYAAYHQRSLDVAATQQTENSAPNQQQSSALALNGRSYSPASLVAVTGNGNSNCGSTTGKRSGKEGKEGYSCPQCRKMFTSSSNLAVHAMIHTGTKPFKCDLCSWAFRQKAHLQKHMRHIHKIMVVK